MLDFMNIKKFCASKDIINRVKAQPTGWETIFANHVSDKGLLSRINRELLNSTIKNKQPKSEMNKVLE